MFSTRRILAVIPLLAFCAQSAAGQPEALPERPAGPRAAAGRLLLSIEEPGLRELLAEVLDRNPGLASGLAKARAAAQRAPQVRALPDPVASVTAFLASPETRTGPQLGSIGLSQGLPWPGKRSLEEKSALLEASALGLDVEARSLRLITEARRLFYELAFLQRYREITEEFRSHLLKHEEISRARYASGQGSGQGVIKIQAEITRTDSELLGITHRRTALVAQINSLRDRPASAPLPPQRLPAGRQVELELEVLLEAAMRSRPELDSADLRTAKTQAMVALAEKGYRPDFKVGLTYTLVEPRDDEAGRAQPPEGNGDDILGVQGGVTIPLWRKRRDAGVAEAAERATAAEEDKRDIVVGIRAAVGDLTQRLPLYWQQLRLLEDLLVVQAEEAVDSAEAGYIASTLNALDLLDAEHVLFQALTATARARADYLITLATLEGAVAEALPITQTTERSDS